MTRTPWLLALALAGCAATPAETAPSIAEFCATSSLPCPRTWSAAQDPTSWGGCGTRSTNDSPLRLGSCTTVHVAEMWGVDASTNYTYDASTGALVSVTGHRANRQQDVLVAGEPPAEVCADPASTDLCP